MIEIIKYSNLYKEELYDFIFDIMIADVKKEPNALKKEQLAKLKGYIYLVIIEEKE